MLGFLKRMRWAALMAGYVVVTTVCQLFRITLPNGFFLASAQSEKIQALLRGTAYRVLFPGHAAAKW